MEDRLDFDDFYDVTGFLAFIELRECARRPVDLVRQAVRVLQEGASGSDEHFVHSASPGFVWVFLDAGRTVRLWEMSKDPSIEPFTAAIHFGRVLIPKDGPGVMGADVGVAARIADIMAISGIYVSPGARDQWPTDSLGRLQITGKKVPTPIARNFDWSDADVYEFK